MFDQKDRRWVILEWAYDNSGWNVILKAEDKEGNPMPLGDWVFNKLFVFRQQYLDKREKGVAKWLGDLKDECDTYKAEQARKSSDNRQHKILDDINDWRRGARELDNLPKSDVTAGYPKH